MVRVGAFILGLAVGVVCLAVAPLLNAASDPDSETPRTAGAAERDDPFADPSTPVPAAPRSAGNAQVAENPQIDYAGFVLLSNEQELERAKRRVSLETFLAMAKEPGTIILDARSESAYAAAHLKGAVNLNFSDFTASKLAAVIPNRSTRILIYCNNNFVDSQSTASGVLDRMQFVSKAPQLALNIPTFISLRGYGYDNVFELADAVGIDDPRLSFEGTAVPEMPLKQARVSRIAR